jgi:RNA polymerase sigma-70 factor (ECF subfamily)
MTPVGNRPMAAGRGVLAERGWNVASSGSPMKGESDRTDPLPTRPSLLGRLADLSDDRSWREFYLTYEGHIRKVARRHGLPEQDAQEIAQDVLRRVAETIRDFRRSERRGAFRSWLFQLTRWRAADRLRRRAREEPAPAFSFSERLPNAAAAETARQLEQVATAPEIDRHFEQEARRHVLHLLLARLERTVSKKNIQMFQMVMLEGVPVARVAELFRTRPAAVHLVKHRVLEKLRAEVSTLKPLAD